MRALRPVVAKLRERAFAPVDIASLVFFRIAFGLLMVCEVWRYLAYHWIATYWLEPRFLFKFYGFSWVRPWPGHWLYIHWAALGLFALFVAAGFLYRISALLFFVSYTYFFLLDEGRYVNHTYLICLFSFLLIFVPAHRAGSVDAWLNLKIRSQTIPAWTLWLLRAQMGVVYFFAALGKISPDWLHGEPMRTFLSHGAAFPIVGRFFRKEWAAYTVSYGGLLFDLLIVPFLLWRRTRVVAFCLALGFHLSNELLFPIGIFPWLAIAATTLFLSPSWPRRVASNFRLMSSSEVKESGNELPSLWKQRLVLTLVTIYIAIQILVPLGHFLYPGGIEWVYLEHRFSWQMMLRLQTTHAYFYVTDPNIDKTIQVSANEFLNYPQLLRMGWRPDMIIQFSHYLATVMPRKGPKPLKVEARVLVSVNGRKPQLFIDPNIDLAAEERPWGRPHWLLQIHEPLRSRREGFSRDTFAPALDDTRR
jgi:vitamin K-dependent gamma-carboxylase-like protein